MSLVEKAAWVIERNLTQDLTLERLAEATGVSRFHLAHAFVSVVGRPVMQYVRERRLSEAARRLVYEKPNTLDVALEAGYGSNEAFTRAFRELFSQTPESIKRRSTLAGLDLNEPLDLGVMGAPPLEEPQITQAGDLYFIGLKERHLLASTSAVAGQWGRFLTRYGEVEGIVGPIPWGVAFSTLDDTDLHYAAALQVKADARPSRGLIRFLVPPRSYLVFRHRGHASQIRQTMGAIWDHWLRQVRLSPATRRPWKNIVRPLIRGPVLAALRSGSRFAPNASFQRLGQGAYPAISDIDVTL